MPSLGKLATSDRVAKATAAAAIAAAGELRSDHHYRTKATNPLEQLEAEIKRCANVVGIFRNEAAIRLVGRDPARRRTTSGERRYLNIATQC